MKIAIIPARGGSKRIPYKNIRDFAGKPMIAWSIDAALASQCFDRIIVSTDDAEIAECALHFGAEVPFTRPAELADDYTGTIPVIAHAIEWLSKNSTMPDEVCCIYATAPFVTAEDIHRGQEVLATCGAEYVFAVSSYAFPIQRALRISSDGYISMFQPKNFFTRSQDLEEAWHDAGQFYWASADTWLAQRPIFSERSVPVVLPRYRVQDIDTAEDWERAEWLSRALHMQSN